MEDDMHKNPEGVKATTTKSEIKREATGDM